MAYNTQSFVKKAKEIHGNKYNYSLVEYINSQSKVKIICPKHGCFEQVPSDHLRGRGCLKCGKEACGEKQKEDAAKNFVARCKEIHGDKYNYDKVVYIGSHHPIIVTCPKHGDFITLPNRLLNGRGCKKCKCDTLHSLYSKTKDNFIQDAIRVHGNMFDYSMVEYLNNKTEINIICPEHGVFKQKPQVHLGGCGCPICGNAGEAKIAHYLDVHHINYKREYFIKNAFLNNRQKHLFADFFIPEKELVIEYNGEQHYKPVKMWGGERKLKKQQERDETLELICKAKGLHLVVIPYTEYNNIDNTLDNVFGFTN